MEYLEKFEYQVIGSKLGAPLSVQNVGAPLSVRCAVIGPMRRYRSDFWDLDWTDNGASGVLAFFKMERYQQIFVQ